MPRLIVIGAAKAGTTALFHYLREHPQLYLPSHEEPSFFAFEGKSFQFAGPEGVEVADNRYPVTTLADYRDLYRPAPRHAMLGDVSPAYLYWPGTAERIKHYVPEARLCVLLRQPADRAYSGFLHARRDEREPLDDFQEALDAEPSRIERNWGLRWRYADQGFYARQLRRFYDVFPRGQILVLLHDDLASDPDGVCAQVFSFAGVDDVSDRLDTSIRYNVSGAPKSRAVHRALTQRSGPVLAAGRALKSVVGEERLRRVKAKLLARNAHPTPPLDPETRARLTARYSEDLAQLEGLIDRDLSGWRT